MVKIVVHGGIGNAGANKVAARCPHCGKEAVLEVLGQSDFAVGNGYVCGQRRCPNPDCHGHLFVVIYNNEVVAAYPPIRLDFDPSNLPEKVLRAFEEAVSCHAAQCYVAAALMVRRTLEEVCKDREAEGSNLYEKIKDLRSKIVVPAELLDAMDELRILGNDAAHIEAKAYESISSEELTVAIEFAKEILKSLYQYSSLLERLRSLKKSHAPKA